MKDELNFSVIVSGSKYSAKQLAFALRDFIKWSDPDIDLVYISRVPETEDEAVAFAYNADVYPQLETTIR